MKMSSFLVIVAVVVIGLVQWSDSHGIMRVPAGRPSMWRIDMTRPVNYDDNGIRCGGRRDKCGVCGDPPDGPFDNELGGKYAKEPLVYSATYAEGALIEVQIVITANHMGFFEFTLCDVPAGQKVTEECLKKTVLNMENGEPHYRLAAGRTGYIYIKLQLPKGFTCAHCVLRWKWKTGNSWGVDPVTHVQGIGYGLQEMFFSCADISIVSKDKTTPAMVTYIPTPRPTVYIDPAHTTPDKNKMRCVAILPEWKGNVVWDNYCLQYCRWAVQCPKNQCKCFYI